jgi:hypothetical protein
VKFFGDEGPIQNDQGIVSCEILSMSEKPIRVSFQSPWPLLGSGLEARDLRNSESAFVQVVPAVPRWSEKKVFQQILTESVLASQGKFGMYSTPYDVKVSPLNPTTVSVPNDDYLTYLLSFVTLTPAMR